MIALFFLLAQSLANAHVVYQVWQKGAQARAELWLTPERAHLKAPDREVFWDLVKERRLDLSGGRSRDEPISFSRILQADELFPRGLSLTRGGRRRLLGRTCQVFTHQQDVPTGESNVKSRFTWCIWRGVPLSLDYARSVCRGRACKRSGATFRATELSLGGVKEGDVRR